MFLLLFLLPFLLLFPFLFLFRFPTHFNDCKAKQNCQLHRTHVARSLFVATVGGRQISSWNQDQCKPSCLTTSLPPAPSSASLSLSPAQPDLATDADGSAAPRLDLSPVSCIVAQAIACPRSSVHSLSPPPPLLCPSLCSCPCILSPTPADCR